ncbi:MAG: hypothetical protein R2788_22615 [Saprospiraceae bacterium]
MRKWLTALGTWFLKSSGSMTDVPPLTHGIFISSLNQLLVRLS